MALRLDNVKGVALQLVGEGAPKIVVCMEYLPTLSVNRYKTRRGITRSEVQRWMEQLTLIIMTQVNASDLAIVPPITVRVDGEFKNKRATPDLSNLLKIVCDSVEDALGYNDREYKTETGEPGIGDPVVKITVSGGL